MAFDSKRIAPFALALLTARAATLTFPAFAAGAAPTISGYAATNPRGVRISSAPPGAPLLIEGANLGTGGTIAFNGVQAPPATSWSPTEIEVSVPAAPAYPFVGPVTVTTNGQTASGPPFTITPPPTPRCLGAWCDISDDQVQYPSALAVDALGNLYVADNQGIRERDTQGRWSVIENPPYFPDAVLTAIAVDRVGNLYALFPSAPGYGSVHDSPEEIFKQDTERNWSLLVSYFVSVSYPSAHPPGSLAVDDAADSLYATVTTGKPDDDRIEKRDGQGNWSVIATASDALGALNSPYALAVDTRGNLYVADYGTYGGRIQKRDAQGTWSVIASYGDDLGQVDFLFSPPGLAVDSAGNLYVADDGNGARIQKRDARGNWSVIAAEGIALGQVDGRCGLAVDGAGNLYVADTGNNRVLKYTPSP